MSPVPHFSPESVTNIRNYVLSLLTGPPNPLVFQRGRSVKLGIKEWSAMPKIRRIMGKSLCVSILGEHVNDDLKLKRCNLALGQAPGGSRYHAGAAQRLPRLSFDGVCPACQLRGKAEGTGTKPRKEDGSNVLSISCSCGSLTI